MILSFLGMGSFIYSVTLESEANKPIQTKYTTIYYYGYYYYVPDYNAMAKEARDKADMKDQADTYKTLGIVLLGMGITMGIIGGTMADLKLTLFNNKGNLFITTIDTNIPAIGIKYNF